VRPINRTAIAPLACAVVVGMISGCGGMGPQAGAGGPTPTGVPPSAVVWVTQTVSPLAGADDALTPRAPNQAPKMTAEEVRQLLIKQSGAATSFLTDLPALTVRGGLYTNAGLGNAQGPQTLDVLSYVFSGTEICAGGHGVPATPTSPATPLPTQSSAGPRCAVIIVADSSTGAFETASEQGLGA
jgi:hypothetical protein